VRERVNKALIFFGLVEDPDMAGAEPRWSQKHRVLAVVVWALATATLLVLLEATGDLSFATVVACVGLGLISVSALDWWSDRRASGG
jgi:hypothetical protein